MLSIIFNICLIPKRALQNSTCIIAKRPRPTSLSRLSRTYRTRHQGLDFPCLEDRPALPYRVSTTPVLWLFYSAHIPESTGYTNINCPSEEFGASVNSPDFAGTSRAGLNCWNRFFRPLNSFAVSKCPILHHFGACSWRNSLSNCSAHVPHIAGLLLCSAVWTRRDWYRIGGAPTGTTRCAVLFSDLLFM